MMRFPEDFYKIRTIMTFEEWEKEMNEWIQEQQELLHRYTELYLNKPIKDVAPSLEQREWYNERVLALSGAIPHNLRLLKRAEVEKEYMIFYREDGELAVSLVSPHERKRIYEIEKMRASMVV